MYVNWCSSHWSKQTLLAMTLRRKHWLQYDALNRSTEPIPTLPLEIVFLTLDRYKIETSSLYLHLHILISNKDMYNGWHSHHSVVGKYSSQRAGEKSGCSVLTFYGHLTSLDRWLTDIVNSTYSTLLNTPSRDYNDNHVTVVRSQSYAWGSPRLWLVLWVSYGRHANSHSTSNNAH